MTQHRVTSTVHNTRHLFVDRPPRSEGRLRVAVQFDFKPTGNSDTWAIHITPEQAKEFATMLEFYAEGLDEEPDVR